MPTFKGRVKLESGAMPEVSVQASNWAFATEMLEAQYGKGSVLGVSEAREMASSQAAPEDEFGAPKWSLYEYVISAFSVGIYYSLHSFGVDWKWAVPIAVVIWLGFIIPSPRKK